MKKFICFIMVAVMSVISFTASAQTVESSRFFDNWSVTLKGGGTTPLSNHAFWGDMRPVVGIEFMKSVTPILSLGVEGEWTVNTSRVWFDTSNHLAFDRQFVGGLGKINLMNAFGGYLGTPRVFEMNVVGGIGWQHDYFKNHMSLNGLYTKFGLDFNFNLGKSKAWTLAVKPDVVFDLGNNNIALNRNKASLELQAGITYHFKNHNGTHSFVLCNKRYSQEEWDALNTEVNTLRNALNECENRPPQIITETVIVEKVVTVREDAVETESMEVMFDQGSAMVSENFRTELKNFATQSNCSTRKIIVNGYASVEGTEQFNQGLSERRANAVKAILVANGINPDMIETIGCGETTQFGNSLEANRVVIVIR